MDDKPKDKYSISSTSNKSASVEDRVISTTATTQKILRAELVDNPHSTAAKVRFAILHRRKGPKGDWEDISSESLATLKARECAKMEFDSATTLKLFQELQSLFAIYEHQGIPFGTTDLVVGHESEVVRTDAARAKVISALLEQEHSAEFWRELVRVQPDLATKLSELRILEKRKAALTEFEGNILHDLPEEYWQDFFEKNDWIFGYGLKYCFLKSAQPRPTLGGTDLSGKNTQLGDFLHVTEAEVKFTVLIEIKRSTTELLTAKSYRSHSYAPSSELAGGVGQLQMNCSRWERDGSQREQNRDLLDGILTIQPKGILVVGHLGQLKERDRRTSFELFRRNIVNPEIVTFDELLNRARFIVEHVSPTDL